MYRRKQSIIHICLVLFLSLLFFHTPVANAHMGSIGYSDVTIEEKHVKYDLFLLSDLVGGLLNIDKNSDGQMDAGEVSESTSAIEQLVVNQLSVRNNGVEGSVTVKEVELTERFNFSMFHIELDYQFDQPIEEYQINYHVFFNGIDDNHQNFLTVARGDYTVEQLLTKDNQTFQGTTNVENSEFHGGEVLDFWDYTIMGMEHIWAGIDHLLFIFGLLLARGSFRDYIKVLTAFTAGHSITLALAALELVLIPSAIIEPLIALSIVYVAVENIRARTFKWRWLISLVFGLIHGFGFAEILSGKLGSDFIIPLLSFNLGVEIGQIVVLMVLLPLILYISKIRWQPQIIVGVSTIISLFGLYWFFERVF
ncbi:HupE/UreJ family protein [Bacillus solitudinis]|uniref:HupE/UreJ family protein n=1 Tax=Bacillus solitudinis TaxID=2014074 RepID=UPI000C23952F|nr:HupE/UreJ family protein [Bacillus solitudinis]